MNDEYKPLTPAFRNEIYQSIEDNIIELNACQNNALVSAQRIGLAVLKGLIKSLPDGYPIPVNRRK